MTLSTQCGPLIDLPSELPALGHGARLAVLDRTGVADGRSDETFDRFARLAARTLNAPVAFVSLIGHDQQTMPGAVWLDRDEDEARTMSLSESVCAFSVATGDETVIEDMAVDPLVRDNPAKQQMDYGSYAGYPLTTEDGHVLGNLCVLDRTPRRWSDDELAGLRDLATLVLQELQHRITRSRLAALRDEVAAVLAEVPPAREAVRLLAEAAQASDEPRLQRTAHAAATRVDRLVRAAGAVRDDLDEGEVVPRDSELDLARTVRRAVSGTRAISGSELVLHVAPEVDGTVIAGDALTMERALSHVLVMVLHHAQTASPTVSLSVEDGRTVLTVRAADARPPTSHLGRAVARLDAAARPVVAGAVGSERKAALRVTEGRIRATAGDVEGTVTGQGVVVRASWPG